MSTGGLHLFLGPDRPQKLQRIHELERTLRIQSLDRHRLDAATTSPADLLALCRQQPAASPVRLIVVDQAHRIDGAGASALLQHAAVIAKTACVILLIETELSVRHSLAHLTAGKGTDQAREGITVERFAGRAEPAAKPFALTEALGRKDAAAALVAVREQLVEGKDPIELLGLIVWQVNRWAFVKRLLRGGHREERIAEVSGWRPWQVQQLQREVAGRSLESIQQALSRCWRLDGEMKSGRTIPEVGLEGLVVECCLTQSEAGSWK